MNSPTDSGPEGAMPCSASYAGPCQDARIRVGLGEVGVEAASLPGGEESESEADDVGDAGTGRGGQHKQRDAACCGEEEQRECRTAAGGVRDVRRGSGRGTTPR